MSVPPSADMQQHSPESTTHSPPVVVDPRAPVPPPPPPSASQSIPVTSDFTNEQIEEFLSNNPELANMTDEQLASGHLEGMDTGSEPTLGLAGTQGWTRNVGGASNLMASGLGGSSSLEAQKSLDPAQMSPPSSIPPHQLYPSPPDNSHAALPHETRSLSPFSTMMLQAGIPPVPTIPLSSPAPSQGFAPQDVMTPPPSSVSSGGSSGSGGGHGTMTIMQRRALKAAQQKPKMMRSAPSDKLPQVGKPTTGLYSSSGFDVLGALSRVVSRPNPRVNLGPVDFSCSFLVVDVRQEDCPIVYSSPTFSVLTGYENKEILGKNCRFLQGPDGQVDQGSRRKYTDNVAVSHLKRNLSQGRECQASLINYRKDGSPFINLVTVVPIHWEDPNEIAFHVGFQVDLVESPNAILKNISDGTYQVNYPVLNNPQKPLGAPAIEERRRGLGSEMREIVRSSGRKEAREVVENLERLLEENNDLEEVTEVQDLEKELQREWFKTLSEHSNDFVHVLSLKGQFQYVSPSVRRILDYDPEDLLNTDISEICHPSDCVPILRELKDCTQAPPRGQAAKTVNYLCRLKRKTGGMVWMECTGRLHLEPGKARKSVILTGRERVMPKLDWSAIGAMGGIGGGTMEGWGMVSYEGLVLYANPELEEIFGAGQGEMMGDSLLDFIPPSEGSDRSSTANTVSPSRTNVPFQEPASQRVADALKLASRGQPAHSAVTVRHQVVVPCGGISSSNSHVTSVSQSKGRLPIVQEVATTIYAIQREARAPVDLNLGSSPYGARDPSSPFGSDNTDSFPIDGGSGSSKNKLKQTTIIFQVKLLSQRASRPSTVGRTINTSFQTMHDPSSDLFEAYDTNRATGWQYDLHQIKIENKRLRERIADIRAGKKPETDDSPDKRRTSASAPKRKRDIASNAAHSVAGAPGGPVPAQSSMGASAPLAPEGRPIHHLPPQHHFQHQASSPHPQFWSDGYSGHPLYNPSPSQYSIEPPGSSAPYQQQGYPQQQLYSNDPLLSHAPNYTPAYGSYSNVDDSLEQQQQQQQEFYQSYMSGA